MGRDDYFTFGKSEESALKNLNSEGEGDERIWGSPFAYNCWLPLTACKGKGKYSNQGGFVYVDSAIKISDAKSIFFKLFSMTEEQRENHDNYEEYLIYTIFINIIKQDIDYDEFEYLAYGCS